MGKIPKKEKKVTAPVVESVPAVREITFTVKLGGKTYEGKGATVYEALSSIERPKMITTKATVTVTDGYRTNIQTMWPMRLKRHFYPKSQKILAKNFEVALK